MVSPVKATLSIPECEANGLPASGPKPCKILTTPGGKTSAIFSMSSVAVEGVCSAGFKMTQLPVANAGGSFQDNMSNGKFQGMICPITPRGSLRFKETVWMSSSDMVLSSALMADAK